MSVFNALNTGIYSALSGGTALTGALGGTAIYYQQAPDGAALPYVVWNYQGGGDENITQSRMKNLLVYVRGYAASPAQAGTIDAYCDTLLHGKAITVTGWENFWTAREEDISIVENPPDGAPVFSAGGIYRIRLT
ncbi:MAG: DUF3168 domain-containing protein [Dehalococcoidia bacterium]|jgi:hypothetical protein